MFSVEQFKALHNPSIKSIEESKEKCYTKLSIRLANSVISPKTHLLKKLLNNKKFLAHLLFFKNIN